MVKSGSAAHRSRLLILLLIPLLPLSVVPCARGQTTISTGSIIGTVTDPSGRVVPGAAILITNKANGHLIEVRSNSAGTYNSGALVPGQYEVRVDAKGFKSAVISVNVQVGVTSSANAQLQLGSATTTVTVQASPVQVNTAQATVQDVVTREQIDNLPITGRNFLDLATLVPGVQIQDGATFDPTKNGYSSVSFDGRFGRTARIEVDGIDISDEMVGTTTQNIPESAIQEFQVEQSSLDLSTELTSSGAVNVTTRSGTNQYHGEGFALGQDHATAARYGNTDVPWDREQYGGNFGGPLLHNKLFFFADAEHSTQNLTQAVLLPAPFSALSGSFNSPFHETMVLGRLDWNVSSNYRLFYRFSFDQNDDLTGPANNYSPYLNVDHAPVQLVGLDFTTGSNWSHSIRFGFTRFRNTIVDGSQGIFNPAPGAELAVGAFNSGPNWLAPQGTPQDNTQIKYDGSNVHGKHIIRYGLSFNHILDGGFASFYSLAPQVISGSAGGVTAQDLAFAATGPFPGGISNPLNYPVDSVILGNGQGYSTTIADLGYPAGGVWDNRVEAYVGDSWRFKPDLNITYGLRYVRDTGRSDSYLPPIPVLNEWAPGLGDRVNQPNLNFAPQVGIAWSPGNNQKTVIRAGAGIFYENAIFNNIEFDAPARITKGLFFATASACPNQLLLPTGNSIDTSSICGQAIGSVYKQFIALQKQYEQAVIQAGPAVNSAYVGNSLAEGVDSTGDQLLAPDYKTPYSMQFNVGLQHQFGTGTLLSVDYVRNTARRLLEAYDVNHVGDAKYLNQTAALNAMTTTNSEFGCPAGSGGVQCAINAGATITDYASNGLDSGRAYLVGYPASAFGLTPDTGAAFPGINPNLGENQMLFPIGFSSYNALQINLRQNLTSPVRGVKQLSLEVSYALSRADSFAQDQDYINNATDFDNINHYYGPNSLDRTHQFSFGGTFYFLHGFQSSLTTHIDTALPLTLTLPSGGATAPAQIFQNDVTGDGTVGDVLPGTNIGSFGRGVKVGQLNQVIAAYNSNDAGKLTPAGQALVSAGLFTEAQLNSLGAVTPTLPLAPAGEVGLSPYIDTDLNIGYVFHAGERVSFEPTVGIYNLFNYANYDAPGNTLSGVLNGLAGSVDGTTPALRTNRTLFGSGVYAFGGPRTFEWGLKIDF